MAVKFGSGKYDQAQRGLFNRLRVRGLQIDYERFKVLTKSNCHYCNSPPANVRKADPHPPYIYTGLDRKDPNGSYTDDNIVPCCWPCNRMKSNRTYEQFLAHLTNILVNLSHDKIP